MLRVLLILILLVSTPLHGFASGVGASKDGGTDGFKVVAELSAPVELSADSRPCCKDTKMTDNKPSFCKPDCKGVIDILTVPPSAKHTDHRWPHMIVEPSFKTAVDLRPPIS